LSREVKTLRPRYDCSSSWQKASCSLFFFFFNDTATTEIYTLSLHDALPISEGVERCAPCFGQQDVDPLDARSEEHTSELQSHVNHVCRLLLEKKKTERQKKTSHNNSRSIQSEPNYRAIT